MSWYVSHLFFDKLTDVLCLASLIGIWPRYIEPLWLEVSEEQASLGQGIQTLRLAHISDLHLSPNSSRFLIKRLLRKLQKGKPDLIVFTGDFLSYSKLFDYEELKNILIDWRSIAPVMACLGNHDYETYVTQRNGLARINHKPLPFLLRAFKRLFFSREFFNHHDNNGLDVSPHPKLLGLLKETGIICLVNQTKTITIRNQKITVTGLGDLWAEGSKKWDKLQSDKAQIILAHNPDSLDRLEGFDRALVLSGHTHGGNINLIAIESKIRSVSSLERLKGWQVRTKHLAYVNRGLGNPYPLRFFSRPELTWINLSI